MKAKQEHGGGDPDGEHPRPDGDIPRDERGRVVLGFPGHRDHRAVQVVRLEIGDQTKQEKDARDGDPPGFREQSDKERRNQRRAAPDEQERTDEGGKRNAEIVEIAEIGLGHGKEERRQEEQQRRRERKEETESDLCAPRSLLIRPPCQSRSPLPRFPRSSSLRVPRISVRRLRGSRRFRSRRFHRRP